MRGIKGPLKKKIAILRIQKGDSEAFGYLYDLYNAKIYRYIYFRISDQPTAYDITQDVFLDSWEYITKKKRIGNLQSFIYRIAYNKVVDYYRSKNRQAMLINEAGESEAGTTEMSDTGVEMHFLKQDIRGLKSEYQDIIILRHMEGMSISEIATILSKDANNVRVLLHRAVAALKQSVDSRKSKN